MHTVHNTVLRRWMWRIDASRRPLTILWMRIARTTMRRKMNNAPAYDVEEDGAQYALLTYN